MTFALGAPAAILATAALLLLATPLIDRWRRAALRRILPEVCHVLNEAGIDYWCDFGTLLGLHRERDIILGDKDADLGILDADAARVMALAPVFDERGYLLTDRGGRRHNVVRIHERRTWYYVDLDRYVLDGAVLRSRMSRTEDVPAALVDGRKAVPFLGGQVRVPGDARTLLVHRYGDRFMTPRRGDKGAGRPFSRSRALGEDLVDNLLAIRSLARAAWYTSPPRSDAYAPSENRRAD